MESGGSTVSHQAVPFPVAIPAIPPPGFDHLAGQHSVAPAASERSPKRRRVDNDPALEDTATSAAKDAALAMAEANITAFVAAVGAGEAAAVVAQVAANAGADEAAAAEVAAPAAVEAGAD